MKSSILRLWAPVALLSLSILDCGVDGQAPSRDPESAHIDPNQTFHVTDPELGTVSFLQPYGPSAVVLEGSANAESAAREVLESIADVVGMQDVSTEFEIESIVKDSLGMTHVTFLQVADGAPVFGVRYGVHFDRVGRVAYVSGRYVSGLVGKSFSAVLNEQEAIDAAHDDLSTRVAPAKLTKPLGKPSAQRVVYALDGAPRAAYEALVSYAAERLVAMRYVLDAADGTVMLRQPELRAVDTVEGSGAGVLFHARGDTSDVKTFTVTKTADASSPTGSVYQMTWPATATSTELSVRDAADAVVTSTDPDAWDTTGVSPGQAVDGYVHLHMVDSFHRTQLNRASYDGSGSAMNVYVHVPEAQDNAFYFNGGIYSGNIAATAPNAAYVACLDVVAHEFQHGVNSKTLGLVYESQSGAIDEGLADIFGCFVEHHFTPSEADNFLIGEASTRPHSNPVRNVKDPSSLGDPDHMDSYQDLPADDANDWGGVHINSTVISHAWYLMTIGGTNATSGIAVDHALGWDDSVKLWDAVVVGKVQAQTASFQDFARAMIATAYQLEGAEDASQAPPAPEVAQDGTVQEPPSSVRTVGCAWTAVGVLTSDELDEHWGIVCDGDASDGPELDCFTGGTPCDANQVCSWNGVGNGYCCKAPWVGTKTCFSEKECAPGICSRGAQDHFYCTEPDVQPCVNTAGP